MSCVNSSEKAVKDYALGNVTVGVLIHVKHAV